jgi:Tfp pilus assembly protein PilV
MSGTKNVLKSRKFKKLLLAMLIFSAGALVGLGLGRLTQDSSQKSQTRTTAPLTAEQRIERSLERLEEGNERATERIKRDVESQRLTQEQADKVTAKLEEIYTYKKEAIKQNSEEKQDELDAKRREWRNWVEDNNVSSRYFIGVL